MKFPQVSIADPTWSKCHSVTSTRKVQGSLLAWGSWDPVVEAVVVRGLRYLPSSLIESSRRMRHLSYTRQAEATFSTTRQVSVILLKHLLKFLLIFLI